MCAIAPLNTSCVAIGAVIGGVTPREDTVTPDRTQRFTSETPDLPDLGDEVEVELRSGQVVAGTYRGVEYGAFAIQTEQGLQPAPLEEVREIRVVRGSYVAAGAGIGLLADVLVFGLTKGRGIGWPN